MKMCAAALDGVEADHWPKQTRAGAGATKISL